MEMNADVVIAGTGVGGLFSALNLPADRKIIMITKSDLESSDSFLAQGGICVLRDDEDYDSWLASMRSPEKGRTPGRGSCSTRISRERRSRASCLRR